MNPEIEALIRKSHESLGAARSLIRDGYFDFAARSAYLQQSLTMPSWMKSNAIKIHHHVVLRRCSGESNTLTDSV